VPLRGVPMSTEITFVIAVDSDRPDKRQQLSSGLDFAMCAQGMRISGGEYEITVRRVRPDTAGLSKKQRDLLATIADSCKLDGCEGACNSGWHEPIGGRQFRTADSLQTRGLVALANGRHPGWTAGHITKNGRDLNFRLHRALKRET
jgi:hypothetical protein